MPIEGKEDIESIAFICYCFYLTILAASSNTLFCFLPKYLSSINRIYPGYSYLVDVTQQYTNLDDCAIGGTLTSACWSRSIKPEKWFQADWNLTKLFSIFIIWSRLPMF